MYFLGRYVVIMTGALVNLNIIRRNRIEEKGGGEERDKEGGG